MVQKAPTLGTKDLGEDLNVNCLAKVFLYGAIAVLLQPGLCEDS